MSTKKEEQVYIKHPNSGFLPKTSAKPFLNSTDVYSILITKGENCQNRDPCFSEDQDFKVVLFFEENSGEETFEEIFPVKISEKKKFNPPFHIEAGEKILKIEIMRRVEDNWVDDSHSELNLTFFIFEYSN